MNVIYKSQKGLDSSILCGGPLTQKRETTTIVGWRLIVVFRLHSILPVMSSYWIISVATTSLHISCNIVTWCTVWLEKTHLQRCFKRVHSVIGMTNSNMTWALAMMRVEWILSVVENEISCAFITIVIPSSWCSYLSIRAYHDNQHTFLHMNCWFLYIVDLYAYHCVIIPLFVDILLC